MGREDVGDTCSVRDDDFAVDSKLSRWSARYLHTLELLMQIRKGDVVGPVTEAHGDNVECLGSRQKVCR